MANEDFWENEDLDLRKRFNLGPFRTRYRRVPRFLTGHQGGYPITSEWEKYKEPWVSPQEYLDQLMEQFRKQPVTYKTDPKTGKVIATRAMARPSAPARGGLGRFGSLFGKGDDLSFSWVLPKGALTGPKMIQKQTPSSDYERQMGYRFGVAGGRPSTATVNPQTHWPGSSFRVPMRKMKSGATLPMFGGHVDYTSGRYYTPRKHSWRFGPGLYGTEWWDPYGRFDKSKKEPPLLI